MTTISLIYNPRWQEWRPWCEDNEIVDILLGWFCTSLSKLVVVGGENDNVIKRQVCCWILKSCWFGRRIRPAFLARLVKNLRAGRFSTKIPAKNRTDEARFNSRWRDDVRLVCSEKETNQTSTSPQSPPSISCFDWLIHCLCCPLSKTPSYSSVGIVLQRKHWNPYILCSSSGDCFLLIKQHQFSSDNDDNDSHE